MLESHQIWITAGYQLFAVDGLAGLKIERLAKKAGISKSSFYHHFADLEGFMEQLLAYHLSQAKVLGEKERQIVHIFPDLIQTLVDHYWDLLFHRQLRIHRDKPAFCAALQQSGEAVGDGFVNLWVRELNLKMTPTQLNAVFELAMENFFLQLTPQNLNPTWLTHYFQNLRRIASQLA